MKALLTAIKAQLQKDLTYIRDRDIFVIEHETLLPEAVKFPAVGLKDGAITYNRRTKSQEDDQLHIKIIGYTQLDKPEAAIMGDAATGKKGALDLIADIKDSLKNNTLSGLADSAWPVSESESELLIDEKTATQMKSLTMQYMRY